MTLETFQMYALRAILGENVQGLLFACILFKVIYPAMVSRFSDTIRKGYKIKGCAI